MGKRVNCSAVVRRLDEEIKRQRDRLADGKAGQPALVQQREALEAAIAACTGRHAIHRRTHLQAQLAEVQARLADADEPVRRLETLVAHTKDLINRGDAHMATIVDEFVCVAEERAPPIVPITDDTCHVCDMPMKLTQEAQLSCVQCGRSKKYLDATSFNVAYGDEIEYSSFTYKRENHFQETLNQFQGKQTTDMAPDTLEAIQLRLMERFGVRKPEDIKMHMVRPVLKDLDRQCDRNGQKRYRKLYEHSVLIYTRLSGKAPPRMTPEQERNVKMLFRAIQMPFEKFKPADRKNFLSYHYCFFKFCQLLGYKEYLKYFSLLKGDDKLHKQDEIMRKIFDYLHWAWVPTCRSLGSQ